MEPDTAPMSGQAQARRLRPAGRLVGLLIAILGLGGSLSADEGWRIDRFAIQIQIQPDGTMTVHERIDADFGDLTKHGIYRDVAYRFDYDESNIREYPIDLLAVTTASGERYKVETSTVGANRRFRIGDPDRTISGRQVYVLDYRVRQALNGFPDHDELHWNVSGTWPVAMHAVTVSVTAPGPVTDVRCFQGPVGSKDPCDARRTDAGALFASTRVLPEGEQMTIVASLPKGVVAAPSPRLLSKSASGLSGEHSSWTLMVMLGGLLVALAGVLVLWWRLGRDRRYVALHRAGGDATSEDERVPFFGGRPIGVEFQPPDRIRPAQVGLIIDERADTLDVTATIVDLAVRGYLKIAELPKQGWFGRQDWQLERLKRTDASLVDYEAIVLDGLFEGAQTKTLSALKNKFYQDLANAKTALYKDAVARGWFPRSPSAVRTIWLVLGFVVIVAGGFLIGMLGAVLHQGALGVPVIAGGVLLLAVSRLMPRRTAAGSDLLHRSLGFAKYIKTAETHTQAFAERANIFTEYLPYAMVFKCVDRWARAFRDIDVQAATAAWYVGSSPLNVGNFSSTFGGFSNSVSHSLASSPGGSGGSGSGGSSGGGGGGGGGGSW